MSESVRTEKNEEEVLTRLPMHDRSVFGVDGPEYELNQRCPVMGCTEPGTDRHHLWRKSFLIGDYWWVKLPDKETVVGNCVKLCSKHHKDITENKTRIVYMDDAYWWVPPTGEISRLAWQPPTSTEHTESRLASMRIQPDTVVEEWTSEHKPVDDHEHVPECPTCHQRIKAPKPQTPPEQKKNRRTWSIAVPKDAQEDGADVLDTLIDEARKELDAVGISYGSEHKFKFHVLATSMALFVQHAKAVLANG